MAIYKNGVLVPAYTDAEAVAATKAGVKLNELQAPTGDVVLNAQKITGLAAAAAAGDAVAADANVRAPDATKLEGSSKATVQTHTPAAHESTHISGGSDDIDSALADAAIPSLATSKITSTRFPVARLPALTDEYIWKGSGTDVEEIPVPSAGIWTLAEVLSPAGVTTIDSSVLAAHDLWMVLMDIYAITGSMAEKYCHLRFNDDAGTNYDNRKIDSTTIVTSTGDNEVIVGSFSSASVAIYKAIGQLFIIGKAGDSGTNYLAIIGTFAGSRDVSVSYNTLLNAQWECGDTYITKFNFLFGGNTTGKIRIYYLDH